MRSVQFGRLVGGMVLAAVAGIPAAGVLAAPDRVQFAPPPPRLLNSERRQAAPPPVPQQQPVERRQAEPAPPPPTPNDAQNDNNSSSSSANSSNAGSGGSFGIKDAFDKLLAAADAQITEKLRNLMAGKHTGARGGKSERGGIEQVYAAHGYAPLWIRDGRLTNHAKAAIMRLKDAATDGLDASDYPVPEFGVLSSAEALAEGDLKLSHSVAAYAHNLEVGRIAPTRVLSEVS